MPLFRLFFDLTANGGWNLCAMCTWGFLACYLVAFIGARLIK